MVISRIFRRRDNNHINSSGVQRFTVMNTLSNAYITTLKNYVKFVPLVIIPIAGLLFMVSIAPYLAVSNGCGTFEPGQRVKRRKLALLFSLSIASFLLILVYLISMTIMSRFLFDVFELWVVLSLYCSFIVFSLFGSR